MTRTRQNVWDLGEDWGDPILWYARGVAAMKARAIAEPTSWRFFGAMHGFDAGVWQQLGYLSADDAAPTTALMRQFWAQCQHGSWYFLPWHRGYLLALEANVRAEVERLGGPDDWALPYWNYFKPDESALPPAFASPDWPDGTGDNPLYVEQRYGPGGDGDVFVPIEQVSLRALDEPDFTGVSGGGSPGFGGVDTGFSHGGRVHGGIETHPHDWVHGLVGGRRGDDPSAQGVMSNPDSAGLDPIFWLHHANIDRLWESWTQATPDHVGPDDASWIDGPSSVGQRAFAMPMPDGTTWTYTPRDVTSTTALDYEYDDLSPAAPPVSPEKRFQRLGLAAPSGGAKAMPGPRKVELIGANDASVAVSGNETRSRVRLDPAMRRKVTASLTPDAKGVGATAVPDRVFLNLENVRGTSDAAAFHVYVGLPDDEQDPADHSDRLAGSIAPFGMTKASQPDDEHGGEGLTFVLEITDIVDQLHLDDSFDVDDVPVRIVPVRPIPEGAGLSIGRISIFREGR